MSHSHNPDTRIVLAPKRWLVDSSLPGRGIPVQAMSSPQTSVPRNFSRYLRFGVPILKRGMRTEVCSSIDRRTKECYGGAIPPRPEDRGLLAHLR